MCDRATLVTSSCLPYGDIPLFPRGHSRIDSASDSAHPQEVLPHRQRVGRRSTAGGPSRMNDAQVIAIAQEALMTAVMVAGPILGVSLVIGMIVSIFQAMT